MFWYTEHLLISQDLKPENKGWHLCDVLWSFPLNIQSNGFIYSWSVIWFYLFCRPVSVLSPCLLVSGLDHSCCPCFRSKEFCIEGVVWKNGILSSGLWSRTRTTRGRAWSRRRPSLKWCRPEFSTATWSSRQSSTTGTSKFQHPPLDCTTSKQQQQQTIAIFINLNVCVSY